MPCSAYPNSSSSRSRAPPKASPSAGAKSRKTPIEVSAGAASPSPGPGGGPLPHGAGGHPGPAVDERDDDDLPRAHRAVGGQAVLRPAQVGLGALHDEGDLPVGGGGGQRLLDDVLRTRPRTHRPASCTVFRMFTFSNSATGQPWLTGATCPGWALPQLNAPPSRYVCGPPTTRIEPQKSVVVAW